jgi:hypothetical protein
VPAPSSQLTRGAVCLALYPFTPGFPVEALLPSAEAEFSKLSQYDSIESFQADITPGDVPRILVSVKLRRILLLQDGTSESRADVMAARINSIDQNMPVKKPGVYRRLVNGTHPTFYLVGGQASHGTSGKEAYVNAMYVSPVAKQAILRRVGQLTPEEMRQVSERVVTSLELDISGLLSRL